MSARPVVDFAGARALDRNSMDAGFAETQLMGMAALASLHELLKRFIGAGRDQSSRVHILAGTGNNGGDGLALAYLMAGLKLAGGATPGIRVYLSGEGRSEASRFYANLLKRTAVEIESITAFQPDDVRAGDILIEALIGTGQKGALRSQINDTLRRVAATRNQLGSKLHYVSLDLPAGVSEDEPAAFSNAGLALPDEIHVYGAQKLSLALHPEMNAQSRISILPMGFAPADLQDDRFIQWESGSQTNAYREYFQRPATNHKYQAGHGLILGGGPGMHGALLMAAQTFFASGGGILHCVVCDDDDAARQLATALPGTMHHSLDGEDWQDLKPAAILIGPGMKGSIIEEKAGDLCYWIRRRFEDDKATFLILDAGAVSLVDLPDFPTDIVGDHMLITPHAGEWARLGGPKIESADTLMQAVEFWQRKSRGHALVKSSAQCFLYPRGADRHAAVFHEPTGALAVAGSGDCLGGILLATLARGYASRIATPGQIVDSIAAAMALHRRAVEGQAINPAADDFPRLIRDFLSEQGIT